jgi:hypothetical protein
MSGIVAGRLENQHSWNIGSGSSVTGGGPSVTMISRPMIAGIVRATSRPAEQAGLNLRLRPACAGVKTYGHPDYNALNPAQKKKQVGKSGFFLGGAAFDQHSVMGLREPSRPSARPDTRARAPAVPGLAGPGLSQSGGNSLN